METSTAECQATKSSCRQLSLKTGPFIVIEVWTPALTIAEEGIRSPESVDWLTVAPAAKKTQTKDKKTKGAGIDADREEAHTEDTQLEEETVVHAPKEYAMDGIRSHIGKGDKIKCIVRWYGHTPGGSTAELSTQVLEHFITRYWRQEVGTRHKK